MLIYATLKIFIVIFILELLVNVLSVVSATAYGNTQQMIDIESKLIYLQDIKNILNDTIKLSQDNQGFADNNINCKHDLADCSNSGSSIIEDDPGIKIELPFP